MPSIEDRLALIEKQLHTHLGNRTGSTSKLPHSNMHLTDIYTPSNVTTDRTYDADTVLVAELADVVGTLIADLKRLGLIS